MCLEVCVERTWYVVHVELTVQETDKQRLSTALLLLGAFEYTVLLKMSLSGLDGILSIANTFSLVCMMV